MSSKPIPMLGKTFFKVKVLSFSHKDKGLRYHYNCKCTLCDHLFKREGYRIRSSYRRCPSCRGGSEWKRVLKEPLTVGDIPRRWWRERVIKSSKGHNGKHSRKKEYNIDMQYGWDLFLKQNRLCSLSGISLYFPEDGKVVGGNASLDRIDSSKGYVKGNVQWVHIDINRMKLDHDQEYFIEMCKKIAKENE